MTDSPRRLERERVLELLYEAEAKGISVDELIAELPVRPEPFVLELLRGVDVSTEALDSEIASHAQNWSLDRIAAVDRLILRVGVWELVNKPDLSVAVIISEAVELAKKFSTDDSGKFVNGVLSAIAQNR